MSGVSQLVLSKPFGEWTFKPLSSFGLLSDAETYGLHLPKGKLPNERFTAYHTQCKSMLINKFDFVWLEFPYLANSRDSVDEAAIGDSLMSQLANMQQSTWFACQLCLCQLLTECTVIASRVGEEKVR